MEIPGLQEVIQDARFGRSFPEFSFNDLHNFFCIRLRASLESADNLAILADDKFLEIPADVGVIFRTLFQEVIHWRLIVTININLGEQWKLDFVSFRTEFPDFSS